MEAEEGLKRRLLHGEGRPSDGTKNSSVVSVTGRSGTQAVKTSFLHLEKMRNYAANYRIDLPWYVISILWDPLYFYTLVINDEKQCIEMDFSLASLVIELRFYFDLAKLIHSSFVICVEYFENRKISVWLMFAWLIDFVSSIIFTQVRNRSEFNLFSCLIFQYHLCDYYYFKFIKQHPDGGGNNGHSVLEEFLSVSIFAEGYLNLPPAYRSNRGFRDIW